jgi:hypothetical protein
MSYCHMTLCVSFSPMIHLGDTVHSIDFNFLNDLISSLNRIVSRMFYRSGRIIKIYWTMTCSSRSFRKLKSILCTVSPKWIMGLNGSNNLSFFLFFFLTFQSYFVKTPKCFSVHWWVKYFKALSVAKMYPMKVLPKTCCEQYCNTDIPKN